MPGNTAKNYTCDQLVSSTIYNDWSKGYSNAIQTIKNQGYTVKGYIVSHPPLQTSHNNANSQKIVYSNDENACASVYRSNWKYHLSNNKMKSVLDNNSNLTFIDNRSNYIIISDIENKEFTWLRNYTTADALHWDKTTTIDYMTLLFNKAGM